MGAKKSHKVLIENKVDHSLLNKLCRDLLGKDDQETKNLSLRNKMTRRWL